MMGMMRASLRNRSAVIAGLTLANALGCGGSSSLVPVEGVVTLDAKPLADADVSIGPTTAVGPGPFLGTTDVQGRFKLGPADDPGAGAAPGTYQLIIATVRPAPNSDETTPPPKQREVVPMPYRNGATQFTVPEAGTTDAKIEMKSR